MFTETNLGAYAEEQLSMQPGFVMSVLSSESKRIQHIQRQKTHGKCARIVREKANTEEWTQNVCGWWKMKHVANDSWHYII